MIIKRIDVGSHLGKFKFPTGSGRGTAIIEFEVTGEQNEDVLILCVIAFFCIVDSNRNYIIKAPCSSNYELHVSEDITTDDLLPIWKNAVKNLITSFNKEEKKKFGKTSEIKYPSNEQIKEDIDNFLKLLMWDNGN